ncbi:MAG TPA: ATP-binding protein [Verrucomicrobiae bacterium]|nr:ATP-binding protein [Verrucomicrobiae bacterium]
MIKRFFKFSTVRMKLAGSVLLVVVPALLITYHYDLPMGGFVVGILALVAAWMGGEFFVRRQVRILSQTAKKIADGDLDARTGLSASEDELGELARILDRMTESLRQRNAERSQAEKTLLNRALEQTVVAALGQFALTSNDLDALLNQAVLMTGQTLDVELVAVFKRLPDGRLLLQAGTGWNSEQIGRTRLPGDSSTQIGHTLSSGEPAVLKDSKSETRFAASPLLSAQGVISGVTIAIPMRGELFGVLGAHTTRQREFTSNEIQFLIAVASCIGMAADHLDLEQQLRQSQKMESVGQLAAGVAHDFNNMLTIIQGHSSALLAKPSLPSEMLDPVQAIFFAAERAAGLTRQLLMFSRKNVMQPKPLDLKETVSNMTKLLGRLLGENVSLQFHSADSLPSVQGDAGMIEQVVMNLAVNARDAMPQGGTLTIGIDLMAIDAAYAEMRPDARPGYFLRLRIADTGTGMDAATLGRIFEPFFTTKEVGKGTGLGLATVYGIVKQHEGWIEVNSEPGKGATFDVFFPISEKPMAPAKPEVAAKTPVTGGNESILLVEDEAILREMARDILKDCGYRLFEASTGKEALALWQACGNQIDLLLTDMVMPDGISGVDLAEQLLADRPELKIIFTSGYSSTEISAELLAHSQARFLQKPYSHTTLARTVRDCLDHTGVNH